MPALTKLKTLGSGTDEGEKTNESKKYMGALTCAAAVIVNAPTCPANELMSAP
jgi:hypothetical protein